MASPSGSSEATGKPRGRDGRPRREEDDVPPEEKRLRLGLEGGSAQPEDCEDGKDAPRPGREETGTQTGGDGRGDLLCLPYSLVEGQDYKSENSTLLPGAKNSLQDSVSRSILLNRLDFETTFASFSASLVSVINHREWFLPETDLAGELTGFEGNKFSRALAQFLSLGPYSQPLVHGVRAVFCPLKKTRPTWWTDPGHSGW
ncbi:LOW QUALITY PROTEIN: RNA binding fox-1 homolog 1 [Homo sapiens]|uniref:RNA binding fox-1 homolog 1 n=1 Tax=Homo sapiens TaxID=9606 RepID=A0A286YFF2_HUMAN|nr:LOW QUALITY PROTEIN: RNA binding fox-1-like 1 [Homo sapiens]KAI4053446.1 LOW QUALITY PROTEIN: RNA binding fox-1 homolog 1 [Homo sapiens]